MLLHVQSQTNTRLLPVCGRGRGFVLFFHCQISVWQTTTKTKEQQKWPNRTKMFFLFSLLFWIFMSTRLDLHKCFSPNLGTFTVCNLWSFMGKQLNIYFKLVDKWSFCFCIVQPSKVRTRHVVQRSWQTTVRPSPRVCSEIFISVELEPNKQQQRRRRRRHTERHRSVETKEETAAWGGLFILLHWWTDWKQELLHLLLEKGRGFREKEGNLITAEVSFCWLVTCRVKSSTAAKVSPKNTSLMTSSVKEDIYKHSRQRSVVVVVCSAVGAQTLRLH